MGGEYLLVGDPKNPDKKRRIRRAAILGASAQPRLKQKNRKNVIRKTRLLPQTSESGANSNGPVANPMRKVVTPNVDTVLEHPKDFATPPMAAAWMLEQKVIIVVMRTTTIVEDHFLRAGQFTGISSGSSLIWGNSVCTLVRGIVFFSKGD